MDNKILGWSIEEIAQLIDLTKNKNNKNLLDAFAAFSKVSSRNLYSIRNFYYKLIDLADKDKSVRENLSSHGIYLKKTSHFDTDSTREIMLSLLEDTGKSVRSECYRLANGDKTKAIRLQNKYRNMIKHDKKMVADVVEALTSQGKKVRIKCNNNILTIPQKENPTITEGEINSLFWGLVRLVKRSAEQELEYRQNLEMKMANTRLQEVTLDVKKKEVLIKELREQNRALDNKLNEYKLLLATTHKDTMDNYQQLNNLLHSNQMAKLKQFVGNLVNFEAKSGKKQ